MTEQTYSTQSRTDRLAIWLSCMCSLHCVGLPILIILLPSLVAIPHEHQWFRLAIVVSLIPVSAYALISGWKVHGRKLSLGLGAGAWVLLILAVLVGPQLRGYVGEWSLILAGPALVAYAHWLNQQFRKAANKPMGCFETCSRLSQQERLDTDWINPE